MAKKFDIKFDDVEAFKKANPHFTVTKEIPAHTEVTPNYAAIRAVLRSGQKLEGVQLVEVTANSENPTQANPSAGAEGNIASSREESVGTAESPTRTSTLREKLAGKK